MTSGVSVAFVLVVTLLTGGTVGNEARAQGEPDLPIDQVNEDHRLPIDLDRDLGAVIPRREHLSAPKPLEPGQPIGRHPSKRRPLRLRHAPENELDGEVTVRGQKRRHLCGPGG